MIILTVIRIAVDALVASLAVGRRSGRFGRVFGAIVGADCLIVVVGTLLAGWLDHVTAGPGRRRMAMEMGGAAVFVLMMPLVWEAAVGWAARPLVLTRRRVGVAAAALLVAWFGALVVYAVVQSLKSPRCLDNQGENPLEPSSDSVPGQWIID